MDRIACALIARYELALRARAEPALWTRPVAVADLTAPSAGSTRQGPAATRGASGRLAVVSPGAEALGVRPGQLAVSARARCPELDVLAPDPEMVAAAEQEILRLLGRLSPRLDSDGRGGFFLGLGGLERIIASEVSFAASVRAALGGIGLEAQVAVADRPFSAWVAARRARPVKIVPPGADRAILAAVPLADLPLSDPAHELVSLLGLENAAELAALPAGELARRLGQEGCELERLLGGRPFAWPREEMVPVEPEQASLELDEPVEDLEPLLFLGKSLVDRVLAGVAAARRALVELRVVARLDDRSEVAHVLRPAEPTLEARPIIDLFRLWLENRPFASPVLALNMTATAARPASPRQLSLYNQREEQETAALAHAVARLTAAFGASCAVRPVVADRHRPEARIQWVAFETRSSPAAPASPAAASTVLRLSSPVPVEWEKAILRRPGQPAAHVVAAEGPIRLSGEWWDSGFDRSYHWLTLSDGTLCWIYRDHQDGKHYLQAVAD